MDDADNLDRRGIPLNHGSRLGNFTSGDLDSIPIQFGLCTVRISHLCANSQGERLRHCKGEEVSNLNQTLTEHYIAVIGDICTTLDEEEDWIAAMATVVGELHNAFEHYHWTGFYRAVAPQLLKIGPYQGGHGCLEIAFDRGVCGAAASGLNTQLVPDVNAFKGHIACSSTTQSEIVVPVITPGGKLLAVLDVDSDFPAAFNDVDKEHLEWLCSWLGTRYA